ncbi:hypothetical protein MNL87_19540, partial [Acinetobacter baumannii]|nr:hypothetical protein [Acinetobacter baumannii]
MVDETRYIPVKVLRQGNIYYLNCEAFDIVEKSSNLLHCIEQMKNRIIEKVVALHLNCEAFDIVEKSSNLLHCIEQMKNRIIEKVVALHHAGEKLPVFDLYKSLKGGGILLEI